MGAEVPRVQLYKREAAEAPNRAQSKVPVRGSSRILTRRTRGISIETMVRELGRYLQGWQGYFGFLSNPDRARPFQ